MTTALPRPAVLTVYGADRCSDCRSTRRYLDRHSVAYAHVDIDREPETARRLADAGFGAIPVVVTPEGIILTEPSPRELDETIGPAAAREGRPCPATGGSRRSEVCSGSQPVVAMMVG